MPNENEPDAETQDHEQTPASVPEPGNEDLRLEPVKDQPVRWNVEWSEIISADPEKLRYHLANMNEQIRRLYELRTLEKDLGRPLTSDEIDLTLHREKAGQEDEAADR
jgi:hypothetical protein